jgi:hypothetical protein
MKKVTLKYAVAHSLGVVVYVALVSLFMTNVAGIFPAGQDTFLAPLAMLTLFVLSAAITGSLVLGRPILWYIDGRKKEAVSLFIYTLGCLFVFIIIIFAVIALIAQR